MTPKEKLLKHIDETHAAMDAANGLIQKSAAEKKAAEDLIPAAVDALIVNGHIFEHQRKEASEALRNPAKALKILTKISAARQDERSTMGQGVPVDATKQASANAARAASVNQALGSRAGSGAPIKESSARLFARMGLPVPAEE